jgi:hypothetical protein
MKHFTLLVSSLATLTSAIDIRFHSRNFFDCNQQWFQSCRNINPNVCCTQSDPGGGSAHVSIAAIPAQWQITAQGGTDCGSPYVSGSNNGGPNICLTRTGGNDAEDWMRGAYYYFPGGKKRSASGELCTESRQTDFLSLGPGAGYDLANVGEADYQRLVSIYLILLLSCLLTVLYRWQSTIIKLKRQISRLN